MALSRRNGGRALDQIVVPLIFSVRRFPQINCCSADKQAFLKEFVTLLKVESLIGKRPPGYHEPARAGEGITVYNLRYPGVGHQSFVST